MLSFPDFLCKKICNPGSGVEYHQSHKMPANSFAIESGQSFRLTGVQKDADYSRRARVSRDGGSTWADLTISDANVSDLITLAANEDETIQIQVIYTRADIPKTGVDAGQSTPMLLMITVALLSAALILALPKRLRRREENA